MMDRFVGDCRDHNAKSGSALQCTAAQEGMTLTL
jgi:hypothetical protein